MSDTNAPAILVYNTLTRSKEPLRPRDPGKISIYACGLTPQGPAHLGHMRGALVFDVIRRWLTAAGYQVTMVQNFTDVDDKIIRRALEENLPPSEIAARFGAAYLDDWESLGIQPVQFVRVTENMDAIVGLVETLVERGHAYAVASGDVYFSVASDLDYGKLSRRTVEDTEAGARIEVSADKRDPMDFALWKAAKPGEPAWPSPWGPGRPGWHIECSALALKYVGNGFDIHGGGIDLIFPHHENEIAQSEAATGVAPFARVWMHWGAVNTAGAKMSKSLGNYFTIRDILTQYSSDVVRLYLLATHYRSPIEYAPERLGDAQRSYERIHTALAVATQTATADVSAPEPEFLARFGAAMNDDFNTAQALGVVFDAVGDLNRQLSAAEPDRARIGAVRLATERMLGILGFAPEPAPTQSGAHTHAAALIERAIAWRQAARAAKQFALSDQIRDDLKALGIVLEDRPQGTTWRRD